MTIKKEIDLVTGPPTICLSCIEKTAGPTKEEKLLARFQRIGGDPRALKQAMCFLNRNKNIVFDAKDAASRKKGIKITNQRYITINDLTKKSREPRLFIIDLQTGEVKVSFSAHGGKQKILGERIEALDMAPDFSNENDSFLTPRGFFITGSKYATKKDWKFGMHLHGIQKDINDNAYKRAIMMHPFEGVKDKLISTKEKIAEKIEKAKRVQPLSWGCTMISPKYAEEFIDKIKSTSKEGGSLYYNYTPVEQGYGDQYCGDENLAYKN